MSRSGYSDDCDSGALNLWENVVNRSIKGKRGQKFMQELAAALDAMPVKRLIANELVTKEGECCTMGAVCVAKGLDVSKVDYEDRDAVGELFDIAPALAAEIAYQNDDDLRRDYRQTVETPEARWVRMRKWVSEQLGAKP